MKARILAFLLLAAPLAASNIAITGTWAATMSNSDVIAGAGSDVSGTFTSISAVASVAVSNTLTNIIYHVYAHLDPSSNLPPNTTFAIRRTSDGTSLLPLATISGGTSYVTLGSTDVEIFEGLLDRSGITLQYQMTGPSVKTTGAGNYIANLVFTIGP